MVSFQKYFSSTGRRKNGYSKIPRRGLLAMIASGFFLLSTFAICLDWIRTMCVKVFGAGETPRSRAEA